MKKLKVYGGLLFKGGRQERAVVAVHNQKEAAKVFNVSLYYLRTYMSETWNTEELEMAMKRPGELIFTGRKY